MLSSPDDCARHVLDVVPLVMRFIRAEMRSHRTPDLTVPQFRLLVFLEGRTGASLSDAAAHLGLTSPSTSVLVNGLVNRGLVTRQAHPGDRRRLALALTSAGQEAMRSARASTRRRLAERLEALPEADRHAIMRAMHVLGSLFAPGQDAESNLMR